MTSDTLVVCIDDGVSHETLDDTEDLTPDQALAGNWAWTSDGYCPICAGKIDKEEN